MLVNMSAGSLEDFYPAIAIAILMRYIRDPSLSQHHRTIVQAITFIFKSLGSKCIPYLSQVVPAYLHVIRASEAIFREVVYFYVILNFLQGSYRSWRVLELKSHQFPGLESPVRAPGL